MTTTLTTSILLFLWFMPMEEESNEDDYAEERDIHYTSITTH
jgi:hypothetical protein